MIAPVIERAPDGTLIHDARVVALMRSEDMVRPEKRIHDILPTAPNSPLWLIWTQPG